LSISFPADLCTLRTAPFCGIVFIAFINNRTMTTRFS
jgi:hypothetical protein